MVEQVDRDAAEAVYPAFLASIKGEDGGHGLAEAFARHRIAAEARVMAEIERLREALREIADPIEYMRRRAEQEGRKIDGHSAVFISNDVGFLKGIARAALKGNQ